jgi:5,10-methylene-tetrahydrofolate dehydrogenase/methenyl tetrahydrofolate cyclohydrolase
MSSSSPLIIDGKATAAAIQEELHEEVERLQREDGVLPGLAVILVGERVDSATYVRMKKKTAAAIGIHSVDVNLPDTVQQEELLEQVERLNNDKHVHGILVQLPLPDHIDEATVLKAIAVEKDADGFAALSEFQMFHHGSRSLRMEIILTFHCNTYSAKRYWQSLPPRWRPTTCSSVYSCGVY